MIDCNKNDPNKMWKTLKELISRGPAKPRHIEDMKFGILDDMKEDGDVSASPGRRRILVGAGVENERKIEKFENIGIGELEKIVNGLQRKKGFEEGISSEILKLEFSAIGKEFVGVINESLRVGCCPNNWKKFTIIPIRKIEKAKNAKDFRLINILPLYEKVLELVVKMIQTVIDEWKLNISKGKIVGVIFMDLKRAFESVDRELLIEKMRQYGVRGKVLEWYRSYLNNRTQQIWFNEEFSEIIITKYGVAQGSVLGSLLFVTYIKDIVDICPEDNEIEIKIVADDTLMYVTGDSSAGVE
ncbi:uncharacterized protein LOC124297786 [Neodiprion virginianus]|uniref:uncharacterized protein LOC124297786 n=1 Tax=Neodiprion virginianus TaxID=2961670 RepID=UPI001EE6C98A|nr:uncharacterized protein LOC124297786 [Neodiprion virginianus]